MIDLGIIRPGTTLYIPWGTFAASTGAPSAMTNLAVGDIQIYKDGSTTQRASTSGFTLLDTDGQDFDALTGLNGISIDLADNTTAGFYAAGSRYWVVISDVTVDSQTVRFPLALFRIGYPDAVFSTTIATLATQTSFTLTAGPAEDDALNGCVVLIHDVASAVQAGFAVVSDYTGATKTVTLVAGTTFTAAATDNIAIYPPVNLHLIAGTAVSTASAQLGVNVVNAAGTAWGSGAITAASIASDAIAAAKIATGAITAAKFAAGAIDATAIAADAITAAKIADGAIDAATFAAGAINAAAIAADAITDAKVASDVTIASVTGAVGSVAGSIGSLAAQAKADVNAEVLDVLNTDTFTEPGQEAPPVSASLVKKIGWLYKVFRNRKTQTSTTLSIYADDATTVDAKATVSDNGTTLDSGEIVTGP